MNTERAKPSPAAGAKLLALAACPWLWGCSCILQEGAVGEHEGFARALCALHEHFAFVLCICALHEHFAQAHVPLGTTTCLGCSACFTGGVIVQPWCFRDAQGLGTRTQGFGSRGRVPCLHPKPRHQARIRAPGACGTL